MKKAQQIRDFLKTGSYTLHEISAKHPDIPRPNINTYLWLDKERGAVVRSGTRGKFKWSAASSEAVSEVVAEQNRAGGNGGAGEVPTT